MRLPETDDMVESELKGYAEMWWKPALNLINSEISALFAILVYVRTYTDSEKPASFYTIKQIFMFLHGPNKYF